MNYSIILYFNKHLYERNYVNILFEMLNVLLNYGMKNF